MNTLQQSIIDKIVSSYFSGKKPEFTEDEVLQFNKDVIETRRNIKKLLT